MRCCEANFFVLRLPLVGNDPRVEKLFASAETMNQTPSSQIPITFPFDRDQFLIWPALTILQEKRPEEASQSLLQRCFRTLISQSMGSDDKIDPFRLKGQPSAEDVIDWLRGVWRSLEASKWSDLSKRRRVILDDILQCGLPLEDQAGLVTALDYLFRLSSARRVALSNPSPAKVTMPATLCQPMQAAYRKVAGLAATDLPIWLAGEKGCEFDWIARLTHQLRGFPDSAFHIKTFDGELEEGKNSIGSGWRTRSIPTGPDVTVFIKDLDKAPLDIQRLICDRLVSEMGRVPSSRIVVSTGPWSLRDDPPNTILHDLFAFLTATRIQIPPLRNRVDDLPHLIDFWGKQYGGSEVKPRLTETAIQLLREHHWPGNIEELKFVVSFIANKRPTGAIRTEDLPETILPSDNTSANLQLIFSRIAELQGFRIVGNVDGRNRLARFLMDPDHEVFSAGDVQTALSMGRETARRLLGCLEDAGLIEGIKGRGSIRTTRYRKLHCKF